VQRVTNWIRPRARRGSLRAVVALALLGGSLPTLAFSAGSAHAAITSAFASVYSTNTTGDIVIRGNTLVTCPTATAGCTTARNTPGGGNVADATLNNNNWQMGYVDVDTDASTFDSSSATVSLPSGSTVLFAALVWGGNTAAGTGGVAAPTAANYNQVSFKAPSSSATTVTAGWTSGTVTYEGYANVTSLVQAGGSGSYTVGNVQTGTGLNIDAGWALVLAVKDTTQPERNLTVFRGYGSIASGESSNIPVSGFTTPPSGAVRTTLGSVSWEGDMGSIGDALKLGPTASTLTAVGDTLHNANNVFDSVISDKGVDSSTRNPDYNNQLGFDAATFDVSGILPNSSTSAVIQLTSSSETYYPGIVTFATDLYAPKITSTKTASVTAKAAGNTQAGIAEPGDTITFTIDNANGGTDSASNTVLTDTVPTGTTYVPGSMVLGSTPLTDANDSDVGKVGSGLLTVDLGSGATGSAGGTIANGASSQTLSFKVTVNAGISDGATIVNTAQVAYNALTSGDALSGASNTVSKAVVLHRSNLSLTKTADRTVVQKGAGTSVAYTLIASNAGPYGDPNVVITDTLPVGAVAGTSTPSAGTCSTVGRVVTCQVGTVANGGTATVTVHAVVDGSGDPATDTATVTGDNIDDTTADETASASTQVNTAPTAVADSATTSGGVATVNVLGNDSDADGDALTLTSTATPTHGTVAITAGKAVYTASAGYAGADSFVYTVTDARGGTATATVSITVPNSNPVAVDDASSTTPGTAVDVSVLANDTDPNIPAVPAQSLAIASITQPAAGTGSVAINGLKATFTPSGTFLHGSTTFTYTVSDGAGGTSSAATVTITMPNVAPAAAADTASTPNATAVVTDVLANDSDANSDPLTVTAVTGAAHGTASIVTVGGVTEVRYVPNATWAGSDTITYTVSDGTTTSTAVLTVTTANAPPAAADFSATVAGAAPATLVVLSHASDPNNDTLSVIGISTPAHGSAAVHVNGDVVYTPVASYAGADSFTYTVSDGNGGTSTATVSLTVSNQAPSAVHDAATVPIGGSVVIDVLANDTDPNADALTVTAGSAPSHGTIVVHVDQTVTYTPTAGYEGSDSFGYQISDGHGGTDTATVAVTVANDPPTPVNDTAVAGGQAGSAITIDVLANDTDPNGDPLTLSSVGAAAHGTTAIVSGHVVYTPSAAYAGPDSFSYVVSDGRGGLGGATVTVSVQNRNPLAVADSGTVLAGHSRTFDVLGNDSDPDGETLALLTVSTPTTHGGTVSITTDNLVRYTPLAGYIGADSFSYVVTDPRGGTATAGVTVSVVNAPPVAAADSATVIAGTVAPLLIDVLANDTDANGDTLTVVSLTTPAHGTVAIVGTRVQYTPPAGGLLGPDTFDYTVSDGNGGLDTATVTVTGVNHPPTAQPVSATTPSGAPLTVDLSGYVADPDGHQLSLSFGAVAAGATVSVNGLSFAYLPAPGFAGTDTFSYTVRDGEGGTASSTVTIHVDNAPPVAQPLRSTTPYAKPVSLNLLAGATDPNTAQTLAVTNLSVDPARATVKLGAGGTATVVPAAGFVGTVVISFDVVDGDGGVTHSTLSLVVVAPTPVAAPDHAATGYQAPVTIAVLANDASGTTYSSAMALVAGATTAPVDDQHRVRGTVAIVGDRLVYSPPDGFTGSVTFTYMMSNALGGRGTASVAVTVSRPPVTAAQAVTVEPTDTSALLDPADLPGVTGAVTIDSIGQPTQGATLAVVDGKIQATRIGSFVGSVTGTVVLVDATGLRTRLTVTIHLPSPQVAPETSEPSTLPFTGANVATDVRDGLLLMLVGGLLVWRSRRRV
jgi:large repetitive protein